MTGIDRCLVSSKPFYLSEEPDSRILRGYCEARELMIRPTIYQGLGPVPRRVFAEDEWGKAEVSGGTAEDDLVLGTPRLQREEQRLVEGCPQKAP